MTQSNGMGTCEDCNEAPATIAVHAMDMETGEFLYVWHICKCCYKRGLREAEL